MHDNINIALNATAPPPTTNNKREKHTLACTPFSQLLLRRLHSTTAEPIQASTAAARSIVNIIFNSNLLFI